MSTLELTPEEILLMKKMVAYPEYWFAVVVEVSQTAAVNPWEAFKGLADKVLALDAAKTPATNNLPECDNMTDAETCQLPVTHIDNQGYLYCTPCGSRRAQSTRCRELTLDEARKIASDLPQDDFLASQFLTRTFYAKNAAERQIHKEMELEFQAMAAEKIAAQPFQINSEIS